MGVGAKHVLFTDKAASGVAPITVDPHGSLPTIWSPRPSSSFWPGNNSIIIVPGANDLLTKEEIHQAKGAALRRACGAQSDCPARNYRELQDRRLSA